MGGYLSNQISSQDKIHVLTEIFSSWDEISSQLHVNATLDFIKELPGNKTTVSNDIPVSVLKESISAYYEKLTDISRNT